MSDRRCHQLLKGEKALTESVAGAFSRDPDGLQGSANPAAIHETWYICTALGSKSLSCFRFSKVKKHGFLEVDSPSPTRSTKKEVGDTDLPSSQPLSASFGCGK